MSSADEPTAASGLFAQIDIYCERTGYAFWAEPINALTNISFFAAASVGLFVAKRADRLNPPALLLLALILCIGTGSLLFHTFATRWAGYADVIPISLFIVSYLAVALRYFFALRWPVAIAISFAFIPVAMVLPPAVRAFAGSTLGASAGYLPAAAVMAICGSALLILRHPAGIPLTAATVLFLISLTFRSLDGPLCADWPLGTHFVWHILNSILLGWLVLIVDWHGRMPLRR